MTFELVRCGWPNAVAVLALAAMPIVALGLPAENRATASQIEHVDDSVQRPTIGTLTMAAE